MKKRKVPMYEQIDLFDQLGFYEDGDIIPFEKLGSVVTFDWLVNHIGYQVALRRAIQSMVYYEVFTVGKLAKGTMFDGCRRIVLFNKGKSGPLLDEPGFFMPFYWHLVYEV